MSHKVFFNVLKNVTSAGSLTGKLKTLDASPVKDVSGTLATAITTETPIQLAEKLETGLNSLLTTNLMRYTDDGDLVFSDQVPPPTFRITRTDHVIEIWSQARFSFSITSSPFGSITPITSEPIPITIQDAKDLRLITIGEFQNSEGTALADNEIAILLKIASDRLMKVLGNQVVLGTTLHENVSHLTRSMFLKRRPVVDYDAPKVKRPDEMNATASALLQSKSSWILIARTGEMRWRFASSPFDLGDPLDIDNEVRMTYLSGYQMIPEAIKQAVVELATDISEPLDFDKIQVGSMNVSMGENKTKLKDLLSFLREYRS